ncbi:hypothetical protein C8R45DRAFT_947247 [Mycena sanguinolenta]|nr:hypothetical protein C8R45DRAFT_947247 [Mycena sanguinolenta]
MTLARLAIFSTLVAATSVSAVQCSFFGNVDTATTAIPLGFGTKPTNTDGNVLLATSADIPPGALGAYNCGTITPNGATGIVPSGDGGHGPGGGSSSGGVGNADPLSMFGSVHQPPHRCPDSSQAWQWIFNGTLQSLVFLGDQSNSALKPGSATNYVLWLVGLDAAVGDYVRLDFAVGGLVPSETTEGLLVDFLSFV